MATHCKEYDFSGIEPHWQSFWEKNRTFRAPDDLSKPKYYVLDMFPYPSGAGLHIGHPEGYTATDIIARYKRARGFNVLHPIGWDAFGLPAEQHAVKTGTHPASNTRNNITNFTRQIKALGFSYDWEREIDTTDPKYFQWTQWIFLQLFRRGLAYVDERPVWWCPELRTVLANEEVIDGRSEVGGFPVERRNLRQWVLRITAYADRLLADLKDVDWPESTKRMQEAWIGRSEGAELDFDLEGFSGSKLKVFTTRPDTLFGCTYMVMAPEHPLVDTITAPAQRDAVAAYRKKAAAKSDLERTDLAKDKSGVFSGAYAINPINGARVPIWIADYVLMGYGTGAIMAVPAHDERDYEFAVQYSLPIIQVIAPKDGAECTLPFIDDGNLVNSGAFSGLDWAEAKKRITADLAARGVGKATVNFKLRDWLFSRQRYWGEPFPVVWVGEADYPRIAARRSGDLPPEPVTYTQDGTRYCAVPLPAGALPLTLPEVESYLPSGTGESPLANCTDWLEIWFNVDTGASVPASQPRPAGDAWIRGRRETNTMPQWAGSCWYYLRYLDPRNGGAIASPELLRYWGVPDLYVGGAEHAVLHLLYARFWHKVLFDAGVVPQNEPFKKLFHQGIILGEDGEKMSKSRGNVVSPDSVIATHGADTLRLYLMFLGPLEDKKPWNPRGIEGVHRFLQKLWRECVTAEGTVNPKIVDQADADSPELSKLLHETVKKVGDDIEALRFNTAISQMMILVNAMQKSERVSRATALAAVQILAPFAPHIAEELWERLGQAPSVQQAPWPQYDEAKLVRDQVKLVFQVNGKHRGDQLVPVNLSQDDAVALAREHAKVAPHIAGKDFKRIIYVQNKILNLVVG
ncbi:leucine--tRNA ligase [mine drainage metagenome]|uniref:leucine--tRNA ligase n=1 Tax=mine drainage metagenome TaxID=410659 RepID=A0A1J5SI60_9ZZZZ